MENAAQALRYTFLRPSNPDAKLVITLAGKLLVTNQLVQEFSSTDDAREHLERVVKLRQRDGLLLQAIEPISTQELERAAQDTDEDVRVTLSDGRWHATFPGGAENAAVVCVKLLTRLKRDEPRRVTLRIDSQTPGAHWAKAIKGRTLPSVRSLIVDDHAQSQTRQAHNSIGDLAASLDAFPALERCFVSGAITLTECSHQGLKELHLLGDPVTESALRGLAGSELPALKRLVLSLAAQASPPPPVAWQTALLSVRAPQLESVHVYGVQGVIAALERLLASGIPAAWRELVLVGSIEDETHMLDVLRLHSSRLAALQTLALPLANEVSETAGEQARALLSNLRDTDELPDLTLPLSYRDW